MFTEAEFITASQTPESLQNRDRANPADGPKVPAWEKLPGCSWSYLNRRENGRQRHYYQEQNSP